MLLSSSCPATIKDLLILQPRLRKLLPYCRFGLSPLVHHAQPLSPICTLALLSFLVLERVLPTAHTPDLAITALGLLYW